MSFDSSAASDSAAAFFAHSLKELSIPSVYGTLMATRMTPADELIPTRQSLLQRLKSSDDHDSWQDFFDTYWRLIYGVALKAGLSREEAEDTVQETVITVARRIPEFHYDPAVCSFKTWLMNLTRWRIIDQLRKRRPEHTQFEPTGDRPRTDAMARVPDPRGVDLEAIWDAEWDDYLAQKAIALVKLRVRPEQFQIFHLRVVKEWPVQRIARELGVNAAQVYLAKHRVSHLIQSEIKRLQKQLL